ncbi:glycosyltransferase involved in LPS biosynthesis [Shewanella psychrophila]|uniref:Glycosyltransferase involved in LPS biosynthesis n=1 Tax=Shewanella psychrophila TaxID=225848 RepID=A0A1S6HIN4_9GAMM|nr:glycosyltransferase family 25 protein [Shewanella psychrophila]AQS35375.1 glycosyltransferase involved in LPS biosynthesis [Shewanella psychrophila]
MNYKVFIINLDTNPQRLASIAERCHEIGLPFERVSGVMGNQLTPEQINEVYDTETNLRRYDKKLNEGEIGCYMSHMSCWKKIVDEQLDFALILEDDILPRPQIVECLKRFETVSLDWDYIKLHNKKLKYISESKSLGSDMQLHKLAKLSSSGACQLVSYSGAEKMLAHALPISRPIDVDVQYWFERDLRAFAVSPSMTDSTQFESDIEKVSLTHRDLVKRRPIKRILLRTVYEVKIMMSRFNLPKFPKI